ncbi:MAG: hypothetical protein IT186_05195 [Acidobacteria bacterium]|nr:hypothetical protein [Acidobacteriota bacterium]MCG3194253.1 Chromosome partition protein Smc [Thermoanaerobaculia bacterium]MCK6684350.1 hypothetical protein [Thermoanaerobaculia bacterium]
MNAHDTQTRIGSSRFRFSAAFLALFVIIAAPACYKKEAEQLKTEKAKLTEEKKQLETQVATAGIETAEMQATLDDVQKSLEDLRGKELAIIKSSLEIMQEGQPQSSRRDQLKAEIATIRAAVKSNLEKLAKLEKERKAAIAKAEEAGKKNLELEGKVTSMERLTEVLRASLEEKSKLIAELEVKVLNLTQTVEEQAGVIKEKEGVIDTQTKEINKAYVTVAKKATLREKGLIEKKGDVLGLGGSWLRTGKFDPELFREIDIRTETEFSIGTAIKKLKVLSDHPRDSYELVPTPEGGTVLKVTDTAKFWQGSKYLVVMIPD